MGSLRFAHEVAGMGLLERIQHVLRANLADLLARADNPEATLNRVIAQMEDNLGEAQVEVVAAEREHRRLHSLRLEHEAEAAKAEKKALLALQRGSEELARAALRRKHAGLRAAETYKRQAQAQQSGVASLHGLLQALEAKIAEARQRRDILLARRRLASAQQGLADLVYGGSSEHGRTVERIEDSILTDETAAEVLAELQADAWESRLDPAEADPETKIEEELARLKEKLSP